jgi:ABC-2 type transport system permease protein
MLSGLCFSLVPNFLFALAQSPICIQSAENLQWFWLLQSTMQFLFYFGTAALCIQLVGSRFAMMVVYGLVNFGALLVYWLIDTLYLPLLPSITLESDSFRWFCPAVNFADLMPIDAEFVSHITYKVVHSADGWIYLAITTAVGLGFGGLALVLYRRRHLETAGDFIAVKWLKPVFLVSYSFVLGAFFQLISRLFIGDNALVFMPVGITVGYFTGQMFLTRSTRVFNRRMLLGFAAFAAAVLVSMGITKLDPLGLTRWVPDSEDVVSVKLEMNYHEGELANPDLLEQTRRFHQAAIGDSWIPDSTNWKYVTLRYKLKNGQTATRKYKVIPESETGELLRPVVSSPEFVLHAFYTGWEAMDTGFTIHYYSNTDYNERLILRSSYPELMECLILDCLEGNLPQQWWQWNDAEVVTDLYLRYNTGLNSYAYANLTITEYAVHTVQWLEQQDFYDELLGSTYK